MSKRCKDCKEFKDLDQFGSVGGRQAHLKRSYCKACATVRTRRYRSTEKGAEVNKASCEKYYLSNKDKWYSNRPLRAFHQAKRRASKLKATPSWLTDYDWEMIRWTYSAAKVAEEHYGEPYHVDHIIPLQGENVCGLHVPWNLQVITAKDNLSKSNSLPKEGLVPSLT